MYAWIQRPWICYHQRIFSVSEFNFVTYSSICSIFTCSLFSAVQMYVEHDHRLINQIKVDDGTTPLHVAANLDHCDILCYLAATVCPACFFTLTPVQRCCYRRRVNWIRRHTMVGHHFIQPVLRGTLDLLSALWAMELIPGPLTLMELLHCILFLPCKT